jgi:hypothetical protein
MLLFKIELINKTNKKKMINKAEINEFLLKNIYILFKKFQKNIQ